MLGVAGVADLGNAFLKFEALDDENRPLWGVAGDSVSGPPTFLLFKLADDCICLSEPGIPVIRGVYLAGEPDAPPSSDTVFVNGTLSPGGSSVWGVGDESFLSEIP